MEKFLKIKGYEDYLISESGKILNKFNKEMNTRLGKIKLSNGEKSKVTSINRLLYMTFIGDIPNKHKVALKDRNLPLHVNNLYLSMNNDFIVRKFSNSDIDKAVNLYKNGLTLLDIAKILKTKPDKISKLLHDRNIPISSNNCFRLDYNLDHNFFKKIDNEEKAYFLGFLYADGGICSVSNRISLNLNDYDILEKFRTALKCDKEFYKNPNHGKAMTFAFSSLEMKKDLIKLGCTPKKSFTVRFPAEEQVPSHLIHHFIRGYFDGDGSITVSKRLAQFKIISSTLFCNGLIEFFYKKFNIKINITHESRYKPETSYFRVCSRKNIISIREFIYNNSTIFLKRKKEKMYLV